MSEQSQQGEFEKRAREVLEESVARLDGRTLSKLTQARHAALDQRQQTAYQRWRLLLPASAAAAGVLAMVMWIGRPGAEVTPIRLAANPSTVDDMELLADTDAPDFVDDG